MRSLFRKITYAAAIAALILGASAFALAEEETEYVVKYRPESGIASDEVYDLVTEEELAELIEADAVEIYEENMTVELFDAEYTYSSTYKWDLDMINADIAYEMGACGDGLTIGIIDSGLNRNHPAFAGASILPGHNYMNGTSNTSDSIGHGTFVAGMICAQPNSYGIIGVAPRASVVPLKCFDQEDGTVQQISNAIRGAVDTYHCDILNLSFGMFSSSKAMKDAIDYAAGKGVIIVASAGNYADEEGSIGTRLLYPAAYDNVIGVGAVDSDGSWAEFSQHNRSVFLSAPGKGVRSTSYDGGYKAWSGTSFSSPLTAGAIADILSLRGIMTFDALCALLRETVVDRGAEGWDEYYGYGTLDLGAALEFELTGVYCSDGEMRFAYYNDTDEDFSAVLFAASYVNGRFITAAAIPFTVQAQNIRTAALPEMFGTETRLMLCLSGELTPVLQPFVLQRE